MLREYNFYSEMAARTLLQVSLCWVGRGNPAPRSGLAATGAHRVQGETMLPLEGLPRPALQYSQSWGSTACLSPLWWQPNPAAKWRSQGLAGVKLGTSHSSWSIHCLNGGLCVYEWLPCQGQIWATMILL